MRVGYTYHAFCRQAYTGITRYLTRLISDLDSQDFCDVKVFAPFYTNNFLSNLKSELVSGHHISANSTITRPAIRYLNSLLVPRQLAQWKPALVHETYYSAKPSVRSECRTVLTVYDMIHEKFPDNFHRWDRTRQLKALAVSRADHIICISENTRRDLISLLNVPAEKISVVYLGVDNPKGKFLQTEEENSISSFRNRPYLLYIGQRGGYKNFLGLMKAYAASPNLTKEFDVICFGGGAFSKHELKFLNSLKINDKVYQINGKDNTLSHLFNQATLFIYPSLYEGFGLPLLEAMTHGCAVACSNTSSIPEVVGNAGAYFNPYDIESIRSTLEEATASENMRHKLTKNGFAQQEEFTWERCAKETFSVYQNFE